MYKTISMVTIYLKGQERNAALYEMWKKIHRVFVDEKFGEKNGHLLGLLLVINKKGYRKN